MIKEFLLVGLGGGIGSMLRFLVAITLTPKVFPYATLVVNVAGSFIIGVVFALTLKDALYFNNWKLFLATGICGGFTTFSAFSLENMSLLQSGKITLALAYMAISIVLGIAATFWGYQLMMKHA